MARTTLGWPCPRLTLTRPEEKSRMRRSPACSHDPLAPVITSGASAPCADHETRTCSLVSRATSVGLAERLVSSAMRSCSLTSSCAYRNPDLATEHDVECDARCGPARRPGRHRFGLDVGPLLCARGRGGASELRGLADPSGARGGHRAREARCAGVRD